MAYPKTSASSPSTPAGPSTAVHRPQSARCWPCHGFAAVLAVGILATLACLTTECGSAWRDVSPVAETAIVGAPASTQPAAASLDSAAIGVESTAADTVWQTDFHQALQLATEQNRPMLLRFTAEWCMPCRVMDQSVFPDREVKAAIAAHVIPVKIDIDEPQSAPVAQRYRVRGIPTLTLVDATGKELSRGGFMSAEALTQFVRRP